MWDILATAAWIISAAIFLWIAYDFLKVNRSTSEQMLLSSREGIDELFSDKPKGSEQK